jgi:hypothetical protein
MEIARLNDFITFDQADKLADEFEAILKKYGVKIAVGSPLEWGMLLLHKMKDLHANPQNGLAWPSLGFDLQEAVGVLHMIELVTRRANHPEFGKLIPHITLLNKTEVAQTKKARLTDNESTKVLELVVALASLEKGHDIELDDPIKSSRGSNPDVMVRMLDGRLWGFACKVARGDAPKSMFDLIKGGIDQIERSKAEVGIVILSLKDKLPHHALFPQLGTDPSGTPILGVHRDVNDIKNRLIGFVVEKFIKMERDVTRDAIWNEIRGKKSLPGVLVPVMVGVGISTDKGPAASTIGFLQLVPLEFSRLIIPTAFTWDVMVVLEDLNLGHRVRS